MKRFLVVGASALLLQACALPVPLQIASWALDGISYLATQKSLTDHGLSAVVQKDCALLRGLQGSDICRQGDPDTGVVVAAALLEDDTVSEPTGLPAEVADELAADDRAVEAVAAPQASWVKPVEPVEDAPLDLVTAAGPDTKADAQPVIQAQTKTRPWGELYFVVGSFRNMDRAQVEMGRYPDLPLRVMLGSLDGREVYRLAAGPFSSGEGTQLKRRIRDAGIRNTWAIRMPGARWTVAAVSPVLEQLASAEPASQR